MLYEAAAEAEAGDSQVDWIDRFALVPPQVNPQGDCRLTQHGPPSFTVTPAATGRQIVRVSVPFGPGAFPVERGLAVRIMGKTVTPDVRVLTHHPEQPTCARRAIVTFPFDFSHVEEHVFTLELAPRRLDGISNPTPYFSESDSLKIGSNVVSLTESSVRVSRAGRDVWCAEPIAPARTSSATPKLEVIEQGKHFLWARMFVPDDRWPRIIEVRADSLGDVAVRVHLQRLIAGDGFAPDLGWRIVGPSGAAPSMHRFKKGKPASIETPALRIDFPDAHILKRGRVRVTNSTDGCEMTYMCCTRRARVPQQETAWRTATFVASPKGSAPWTSLLEPAHDVRIAPDHFDAIYGSENPIDLGDLDDLSRFHRDATVKSALDGDDAGNVTGYPAAFRGMNRLNHCPPIFVEYRRGGDTRLRETALRWCENFHDLGIWWGASAGDEFGGTRYNNISLICDEHKDDKSFMWRSNSVFDFCTKGFDSFFLAYEETGDPRFAAALRWQVNYVGKMVHVGVDCCRNVGIVADLVVLHRFTGDEGCLNKALRLFGELRTYLSDGDLFTESGKPIAKEPPFIDDDSTWQQYPYPKPYILNYALQGLPELAFHRPDEPKLRDVVRAVADFIAATVDPSGGWRYPHPRSRNVLISQGMEHAAGLMRAARYLESRGEPIENLIDGIECVLRARVLAWRETGTFLSHLGGWEEAAGLLPEGKTVHDLYKKPEDRDTSRDYTEGPFSIGCSAPEGVVYFWETLNFYLAHRPAERLLEPNSSLKQLLDRLPARSDNE